MSFILLGSGICLTRVKEGVLYVYWLKHMKMLLPPFNTACCCTFLAAARDNDVLLHAALPQTTLGKQVRQTRGDAKSVTATTKPTQ